MTNQITPAWITEDIKNAYAFELARHPGDALKAATLCVPNGDWGMASELMCYMNSEVGFVDRQRDVIAETGAENFIPSKELVTFEVLSVARTAEDKNIRLKAYELAAKMQGWIEKGVGANVNVNVQNNRVMIVRRHDSMEEFEAAARAQQDKLIIDASASYKAKADTA